MLLRAWKGLVFRHWGIKTATAAVVAAGSPSVFIK